MKQEEEEVFTLNVKKFCSLLSSQKYRIQFINGRRFRLNGVEITVSPDRLTADNGRTATYFSFFGFMKGLRKVKCWDCNYPIDRKLASMYSDDEISPIEQYFAENYPEYLKPGRKL